MEETKIISPQPSRLTVSVAEIIAALGVLIASVSLFAGLIVLPEQVRTLRADNDKQDVRISILEKTFTEKAETIARIDERTKRIEAAVSR